MKQFKKPLIFLVLLIVMNNLKAQDNYTLSSYLATINGTSTLHNWDQTVERIAGKGIVKQNADKSLSLQSLKMVVQVNSIKSSESMESKTYKALKADKFPQITFVLTEPLVNLPYRANAYGVRAKGQLTIAGVTKEIVMPLKITLNQQNKITVDGAQQIKMTDYGIDPPTMVFGTIKVGALITFNFKTTFSLSN
ncbi:MAG: YceI family protein [Bacteroidota bacterium]|nr:YceI family protein [Bacteroidota bacterium]